MHQPLGSWFNHRIKPSNKTPLTKYRQVSKRDAYGENDMWGKEHIISHRHSRRSSKSEKKCVPTEKTAKKCTQQNLNSECNAGEEK